jgi:PilZ domain-containing protein
LFQESQRAIDIMRCQLPEQRREARIHNQASGSVFFVNQPQEAQTAHLRDLNTLGAFFYSKLAAAAGQSLALHILMPKSGDGTQLKMVCEGMVVRVESGQDGVGTGFAIQFSRYDISWIH